MNRMSEITYINSNLMDNKYKTDDLQSEDSSLRGYYTKLEGKQIPVFWRITVPSPPHWSSNPLTVWLKVHEFFIFTTLYTHSDIFSFKRPDLFCLGQLTQYTHCTWIHTTNPKCEYEVCHFYPSPHPSARLLTHLPTWNNSNPTGQIFLKFILPILTSIC
jgi:hypothetical protein